MLAALLQYCLRVSPVKTTVLLTATVVGREARLVPVEVTSESEQRETALPYFVLASREKEHRVKNLVYR